MVSADVEKLERLALHIDEFAKAVMQTAMKWAVTLIVVGMIAAMEDPDHDPTAASSNEPDQPVEEADMEQTTLQQTLELCLSWPVRIWRLGGYGSFMQL